jgi:pimeloyl-ACP methyl ester carboxylesterase
MNRTIIGAALLLTACFAPSAQAQGAPDLSTEATRIHYRTVKIDGLSVFYREAGSPTKPTILLLHGFPTSSHMFRDLIPLLADRFHLVAPDYPGFGNTETLPVDKFAYTFAHLTDIVDRFTQALKLNRYSIYVQDYGAPIGFRLATLHPERIQAIISQNGNAYEEGLTPFWGPFRNAFWKNRTPETEKPLRDFLKPEGTQLQYLAGVRNKENINPDAWIVAQAGLDRPGNNEIQVELFYDYRTNLPLYDAWHQYFRQYQPPTLLVWGKNDPIFGPEGARAFQRDLKNTELHLLNTGHFALEEDCAEIAGYIRNFLGKQLLSGGAL